MKKLSWPYIGDPELEMGSMSPAGDPDRDIQGLPEPRYDAMVASKHTTEGGEVPAGYSEGMIFPAGEIYSDLEEDEYAALGRLSEKFLRLLRKESTVLGIGRQKNKTASLILREGHNLINLVKKAENEVNINNFHQEYGNPMFHSFRNKFDGFYITSSKDDNNSLEIILNNILDHLRPISCGLIVSGEAENISSIIKKLGFIIIDEHVGRVRKYLVAKNNLDKIATTPPTYRF